MAIMLLSPLFCCLRVARAYFFMGHGPSRARLLIGFKKSSDTFLQSVECVGPPMPVNLLSPRNFYVIWKTIGFFF